MGSIALALIGILCIATSAADATPTLAGAAAIGCRSDGQTGPEPAQTPVVVPKLTGASASRLAYYEAVGLGVLAPAGWHCFGLYGSNGSFLIVTPERHAEDLLTSKGQIRGRAVQLSLSLGDTSGRFEAAQIAARLFPSRRHFVEGVMAEQIEPRSDFHFGPFSTDVIRRFGDDVVEFTTPPNTAGMGSYSRLVPNGDPISGLAMVKPDNSVFLLVVRLPESQRDLAATIIKTVRKSELP